MEKTNRTLDLYRRFGYSFRSMLKSYEDLRRRAEKLGCATGWHRLTYLSQLLKQVPESLAFLALEDEKLVESLSISDKQYLAAESDARSFFARGGLRDKIRDTASTVRAELIPKETQKRRSNLYGNK